MAMRRTIMKLAAPGSKPYAKHLAKQWKHYNPTNGEVMQHLSPFEQEIVKPLFTDLPKKILRRAKEWTLWWAPGIIFFGCMVDYCVKENKRLHFHHRC